MNRLWAITSYFNPMRYRRRLQNYFTFQRRLTAFHPVGDAGSYIPRIDDVLDREPAVPVTRLAPQA